MFKKWLKKLKELQGKAVQKKTAKKSPKTVTTEKYPNRFLKFYHVNKGRLNTERRSAYAEKKKAGLCTRCQNKALPGIVFCEYHRQRQKEYNLKSRGKREI